MSGALRRPSSERTLANKEKAISYAAFRALSDVLPADTESVYKPLMKKFGYDPANNSTDIETPEGIGNVACAAVLEFRHHDKSNQLGDMQRSDKQDRSLVAGTLAPYGDWTGYTALNAPGTLPARATFTKPLNPDHWQPLTYTDSSGNFVVQMFQGAQWPFVTPFALTTGDELRAAATYCSALSPKEVGASAPTQPSQGKRALAPEETSSHPCGPAKYGTPAYQRQAEELITLSANLTDEQKMLAEFWTTSPDSDSPITHWMRFAEFVSERDQLSLDNQIKLFFVLSNTMMDADIAAWDAKRFYDSVRPATAIPLLFRGKKIQGRVSGLVLANPEVKLSGQRAVQIDGGNWLPYQPATFPHSCLSRISLRKQRGKRRCCPCPEFDLRLRPFLLFHQIRKRQFQNRTGRHSRKSCRSEMGDLHRSCRSGWTRWTLCRNSLRSRRHHGPQARPLGRRASLGQSSILLRWHEHISNSNRRTAHCELAESTCCRPPKRQ